MIRFKVPLPPSTNNLYANRPGGRVITGTYQRWLHDAGWLMVNSKGPTMSGRIAVEYQCERPNRRRDLGNIEKPLSDLLVKQGVIRDDSDIERIVLTWNGPPKIKDQPMVYIGVSQL